MSTVLCISSSVRCKLPIRTRGACLPSLPRRRSCRRNSSLQVTKAMLENDKKKAFLTKEDEPEQYWSSASEREGANPLKDPLAIIGLVSIFFPFILLLIAIASGYIDVSVYR